MLPRKMLKVKTKICAIWNNLEANLKKSSTLKFIMNISFVPSIRIHIHHLNFHRQKVYLLILYHRKKFCPWFLIFISARILTSTTNSRLWFCEHLEQEKINLHSWQGRGHQKQLGCTHTAVPSTVVAPTIYYSLLALSTEYNVMAVEDNSAIALYIRLRIQFTTQTLWVNFYLSILGCKNSWEIQHGLDKIILAWISWKTECWFIKYICFLHKHKKSDCSNNP